MAAKCDNLSKGGTPKTSIKIITEHRRKVKIDKSHSVEQRIMLPKTSLQSYLKQNVFVSKIKSAFMISWHLGIWKLILHQFLQK